jgi:hypothetical protein
MNGWVKSQFQYGQVLKSINFKAIIIDHFLNFKFRVFSKFDTLGSQISQLIADLIRTNFGFVFGVFELVGSQCFH